MDIKPIHRLTRTERRDMAHAAADRGDHLHEACPHAPGTQEHNDFHNDYVERRFALMEPERA